MWKRSRWAPLPVTLALVVLLLSCNGWVSNSLVTSLEWQYIPQAELPVADAIVILGGGTKAPALPRPGVEVGEAGDRVLYGAELYRQGKAPLVIVTGGRINWRGGGPPESEDMAAILSRLNVPKSAIIQESNSFNTYQNAVNVRKILKALQIRRVLLVTSAMHMPRSLSIFRRQKIDALPAPTDFLVTKADVKASTSSAEAILLNLLPDSDNLDKTTQALKEYIGTAIYRLRGWL